MTSMVDLALFYRDLFDANKDTGANLDSDVFYGDQTKISGPLTICVEPGQKENTRTRAASTRAVQRVFLIYVYVYSNYTNELNNRLEADILAEKIEELINKYPYCNGRAVGAFVTVVESGYVTKQSNNTYATTRISITVTAEELLPQALE